MKIRKLKIVVLAGCLALFSMGAGADPIIGVTVDGFINPVVVVGNTANRPIGNNAVEYFIPLSGGNCTYGVGGCGLSSDSGNGGPVLTMNFSFSSVGGGESVLNVLFEDLDLIGVNDPSGFLESVQVFDGQGGSLTGVITNISSLLVSGNSINQMLSLALGDIAAGTYFLSLRFSADSSFNGTNTPEYLIASISAVPLPGALLLFGTGLLGFLGFGRRKKVSV